MDMLLLSLSFVAGWLLGGDRPSPPPPVCPPVTYPIPPAELMGPLPLDYLLPPEMQRKNSQHAAENATK